MKPEASGFPLEPSVKHTSWIPIVSVPVPVVLMYMIISPVNPGNLSVAGIGMPLQRLFATPDTATVAKYLCTPKVFEYQYVTAGITSFFSISVTMVLVVTLP
jgi:hypothetical protein